MKVLDIDGNEVTNPDLEAGRLEAESILVTHVWVIDVPEKSHEEVIAEYPETGGKDIATVIDVEEQGHWKTVDVDGEEVGHFDGSIPDDLPHDTQHQDMWSFYRFIPYTAEEIAKRKAEAEAEAKNRQERESFLTEAPERVNDAESALAELGEIGSMNNATIEELQQAVAELGAIVAAQ